MQFAPSASPSLTATIWGTPTQTGNFTFTVTLTDSSTPQSSDSISYTVTISQADCYFPGTSNGSISFNNIDPSTTPGPILGTVTQQINFICKNNLTYTITASPATGWTIDGGSGVIPYTLGFAASGVGSGAPVALLTNTTQLLQTNYANALAGFYANSQAVSFTIGWTQGGGGAIIATLPVGGVNGTVINTCSVFQSPGALTFTIDPSVAGTTNAAISPDMQIKCTNGNTVMITSWSTCGGAAPVLDSAYPGCGGSQIPYTFNYVSSTTGLGFGTPIPLAINGSANSTGYANAPVGAYGDLQTLTIGY